jgi:hypothetical protein
MAPAAARVVPAPPKPGERLLLPVAPAGLVELTTRSEAEPEGMVARRIVRRLARWERTEAPECFQVAAVVAVAVAYQLALGLPPGARAPRAQTPRSSSPSAKQLVRLAGRARGPHLKT